MLDVAERRWLAAFIDVVAVLLAATSGFGLIYALVARYRVGNLFLGYFAVVAIPAIYSLIELVLNASPGKLATRLRITDARGLRPRRWQSTARWLLKLLPLYLALFCVQVADRSLIAPVWAALVAASAASAMVADYISLLSDPPKKPLHDRLTGTEVRVKDRPERHGFPVGENKVGS